MSKQTRTLLWPVVVILFLLGIWPIALLLMIALIISQSRQKTKELEEMKLENQKLQQELKTQELKTEVLKLREELADQAVRRAMDQAEKRGE